MAGPIDCEVFDKKLGPVHQVSLHSHEGLKAVFFVTCPLAQFKNPLGAYSNEVRVKFLLFVQKNKSQ